MVDFNNPPTLDLWDEPQNIAGAPPYAQKNHNWYVLRQYGSSVGTWVSGVLEAYDIRFNNMISNAESVNEVVDARVDVNSKVYPTLKARLDAAQETTPMILETGVYSDAIADLNLTDLEADSATNTASLSYDLIATIADPAPSSAGFAQYKTSSITID